MIFIIAIASILFTSANAECANACNGHGRCTSYDMCICNRNWMANDCSERVCQFGLAHVDTPKGDLDMSGSISDSDLVVTKDSFVYPYGTTEQFPFSRDSELNEIQNSAHYYMECSNKGTCDRTSGTCNCYDGYDGAACQRASCPGTPTCSGHGVCKTIKQLAEEDYGNVYELWDKHSTMGCSCDKGYYGADCSERDCKFGVDPLYLDDSATIKYPIYDFGVLTTSSTIDFTDGTYLSGQAYFAIRFYDAHGEDWLTQPIKTGASCSDVVEALEALPNNVVPSGQTWCTLTTKTNTAILSITGTDAQSTSPKTKTISYPLAFWEQTVESSYTIPLGTATTTKLSGYIYRLKFYGNPGKIRQPEIEIYLDGKRPSVNTATGKTVITKVWTDGQQGEFTDMFADHCDSVTVQLYYDSTKKYYYLDGMTTTEKALLKDCLGASDFNADNNVEIYNWDHGSYQYPHLIKLVKSVTTFTDGGYYVALFYDTSGTKADSLGNVAGFGTFGTFRLLNPFTSPDDNTFSTGSDFASKDEYEVYTTKGTLGLTSNYSQMAFGFASQILYSVNVSYDSLEGRGVSPGAPFDGDISCEIGMNNAYKTAYVNHCLNKSDMFVLLSFNVPSLNPPHLNIYTAEKLYTAPYSSSVNPITIPYRTRLGATVGTANSYYDKHVGVHRIITDISTNWATVAPGFAKFHAYKFFPAEASSYEYVAECSNRGICNTKTGICECFSGYSYDDCSQQNSLNV